MRVAILTEADARVGYGHLARCTALYQAFETLGAEPELIIAGGGAPPKLTSGLMHRAEDWRSPAARVRAIAADSDVTVIDSYVADPPVYAEAASAAGVLVSMDDTARLDYPAGIVVNGAIRADTMPYPCTEGVAYLLGPVFATLRADFWDVPSKQTAPEVRTVLVAVGGTDIAGLAPRAVAAIERLDPGPDVIVVLGSGDEVGLGERAQRLHAASATEVLAEMLKADLCVATSGQTLTELARVGVPTVAVCVAENQRQNGEGWADIGFAEYVGDVGAADLEERIATAMERLAPRDERARRSRVGRQTVDGRGALRVARRALGEALAGRLTFEPASREHMQAVFELANDPEVRQASFSTEPISLDRHHEWFEAAVTDPRCVFLVALDGGKLAGLVRFSCADGAAVVTIWLAEPYRGRGAGPPVLDRGIQALRKARPDQDKVEAYVKPENARSARMFERAGFASLGETRVSGQPALGFELDLHAKPSVSRQVSVATRGHHGATSKRTR
jgi:spore coat polysaccharide biosynthesis predicted glycosyltransferase SpsG/L-amino acid N-acyltransferase YncA